MRDPRDPQDLKDPRDPASGGAREVPPALRIEPERRLCPGFDPVSIALHEVAGPGEMGFRVLDDFCEEHIQ